MSLQKRNHIRSKKIRDSANGETCCWPDDFDQDIKKSWERLIEKGIIKIT